MSLERVKLCVVLLVFLIMGPYLAKCEKADTGSSKTTGQNDAFEFHSEDQFCVASAKLPFYQRDTDGAICCRGKQLPVVQLSPEITGDCAINTTTGSDGLLESESLWCAYSCSLKKIEAIDNQGKIVPEKFFEHLTQGLTGSSKTRLKTIMTKYLGCFTSMKNEEHPCYTPLSFHKCYLDALVFLCSVGLPKNNDFSSYAKVKADYTKLKPFCYFNNRKVMPGCCHGKPLPWTIPVILESARNDTGYNQCITEMGNDCDATCLLKSLGVVNSDFDLDVNKFSEKILNQFPMVQPSAWMDYNGPVFLFFDEVLADMGDEATNPTQRICRFHDRVMELHESKVDQYCTMSAEEVKQLIKGKAKNNY